MDDLTCQQVAATSPVYSRWHVLEILPTLVFMALLGTRLHIRPPAILITRQKWKSCPGSH